MSVNSIPLSDLESSPSAKFENIGESYSGRIVSMVERQQTDINTGALMTFPDGQPRMQWVFTLVQANGENVALWARGGKYKAVSGDGESMLGAIGSAIRAAGASAIEVGGELAVQYSGVGEATAGRTAPKLYRAQYRPPSTSAPADLFQS